MQFGFMTEPQAGGTYDELLGLTKWAEGAGLDVFARSDHWLQPGFNPHATDAFASLAGLARETDRIGLCVLVSPLTFRHPAVIAKNAATIDEMSGGRLILGVGTGWQQHEHDAFGIELPDMSERFDRLLETLSYLWAAFGRSPGGFEGRYYSLADVEILPRPTGDLPIIVGGAGPKRTPRLAGRFADEYNTFVSSPDDLRARIGHVRESASEHGRNPDDVLISIMGPALVGADDAEYRSLLETAAAGRDLTPEEFEQRLIDRGAPIGTPDRAQEALAALEEAGVDRYYLQVFAPLGDIQIGEVEATFGHLGALA
ncbi:MAG: LLM class flavin-dependent oxidoreductase [Acidimicrobiia bacterium]|nr:LLM class flavin-dependent oxidoreductase [Acidimicrobiia bacterium]NNC75880.1 LLM class flavin-dependent oxidoreductase [Acidimicrobiia bacterium]